MWGPDSGKLDKLDKTWSTDKLQTLVLVINFKQSNKKAQKGPQLWKNNNYRITFEKPPI